MKERILTLVDYFKDNEKDYSLSLTDEFDFEGMLMVGFDKDGEFIGAVDGSGEVVSKDQIGKYKLEVVEVVKYHYVTFCEGHVHEKYDINHNCVARLKLNKTMDGRRKAFDLFNIKFCFEYSEDEWDEEHDVKYFRSGYVDIDLTN